MYLWDVGVWVGLSVKWNDIFYFVVDVVGGWIDDGGWEGFEGDVCVVWLYGGVVGYGRSSVDEFVCDRDVLVWVELLENWEVRMSVNVKKDCDVV